MWYSNFQNKDPIKKIELLTPDVVCAKGCKLPSTFRFNLMEIDAFKKMATEIVKSHCQKFGADFQVLHDGSDEEIPEF